MTRSPRVLAIAAVLLPVGTAAAAAQGLASVRAAIEERVRSSGAEAVGVYVRNLDRPDSLLIDARPRPVPAAR